ncbi:MAG: hypothetical protein JWO92_2416 [Chitinophagaceae bacterium]|nr:hypothetical protein [Chitinophagaceae bacterium]
MLLEETLVLDKKNDTLLYAGSVKVNITDWFFLKDNITLKYVALDNALINLNRKDSTWNYQFLVDYFSSPARKKDTSTNVIKLDLKTVEMNRVKIWKKDEWSGQNVLVSFDKLNFTPDVFDTKNKTIKINEINLDHPLYAEYNYQAIRPKIIKSINDPLPKKNGLQWNEEDWLIAVKNINIKDGGFSIESDNGSIPYSNMFDGGHIIASSINGSLKNVQFAKDTITANINIAAKDRSGFEIKKLAAAYKFTPQQMEFKNLDLITNRSHIRNYYVMRYNNFNNDFANFEQAVTLEANFTGSEISSEDISYFAPSLKTWQRNFFINGNVTGTIDNLSGRKMLVRSNNNYFDGDIAIRGLPNNPYLNLKSNELRTSYAELATIIPSLKKVTGPNLSALGNIHFTGNFTGFFNDFVTYGTLTTDLGTLVTDLHMQFPGNSPSIYSGKVATNNFRLGKFIGDDQLGNISFNGNIAGKGFNANNVDVTVDGNIKQIEFNNYNYQDIIAKGNFKNKVFKGAVSIDDPNVKIDGLVGTVDLRGKEPIFNFDANVARLNLKNIQLTNDNFSLTGKFNLNFSGNNIDNFLGAAKIYNATLLDNDQKLSFDSLTIRSTISGGKKYLLVQSNELDANVSGNFKILELPEAFQLLLNRYYPAYINKPRRNIHAQDFTFDIKTKVVSDYIGLLSKKINGFNNTTISGNLNLSTNTLNITANVPSFNYNNIDFSNLNFTGTGTFDTLTLAGNVGDIIISDSLHLPDTKFLVTAYNDISDISIKTSASKTLNDANLSLRLQTLPDGFKLNFNPSSFVINDKKWILEKGGELVLSDKLLTASEVKFVQNDQQIIISTEPSSTGNSNDVLVELKKINIGDVVPFFIRSPRFEGLMTGHLKINDPFGNATVGFVNQIDQFRFENDSIGILKTSGSYSSVTGDIVANASSNNSQYTFIADVTYKTKDSTNNQLNGSLNLDKSNISFLQKYLTSIFTGLEGNATGQLNITGRGRDPKITGSVTLNDASLTVNYTRCKYFFNNNSILKFNKDEIDFGTLKIRDTLNNTATISGKLYHTFFDNFYFNELHFKTDRKNGLPGKFLLLNTTAKDNNEFYGRVIGDAEMQLDGPISDMKMNITGQPTDSSHIYLPTGDVAETGKINYIEFIKFGREMRTDLSVREEVNIKVNMEITATPFAQIDVILDETTGDIIKANGRGKLNISVGTKEPLTIRGRYDVEEGEYTFNFQTFLKTPFTLQSGYIEWQGDPYLANLNIDAVYRAKQVDLSTILTTSGFSNTKGDVDVVFKLRGTLKDPRPDFEFAFPFDNPLRSDPIANQYLKTKYQADKNVMNKQVTSLLLFNSFISDDKNLFTTNNTGNFVFRTVGQVLSNTLSSSLNNWLQKLLKTDQVNLYTNINTSDFNLQKSLTQKQLQNLGNFGFKTAFLNNRLLINFGGNVDYRLVQASNNSNTNFLFTPDVSFEYLISPGGSLRVVGFNRSDADLGDIAGVTRRNRTGILLSYRKDFNTFYELFGIDKRR